MKISVVGAVAIICLALLSNAEEAQTEPMKPGATASVKMKNATNQEVGEATLTQTPQGVLINLRLANVAAGPHAFHIHETGKCEPPFTSAGAHFNPKGKKHGLKNPSGRHAGDLPNLYIPANGTLTTEIFAPNVNLRKGKQGLLDGDGSALVLHEKADDYQSDPAGDAGGRIVCGVINTTSLAGSPTSTVPSSSQTSSANAVLDHREPSASK